MRLLAEIVNVELMQREGINKKTGELEKVHVLIIYAVDKDFPSQMNKISIWREYDQVVSDLQKGAEIEVIFRNASYNNFEKVSQILCRQEDIEVTKTAMEAIKEMQATLSQAAAKAKARDKEEMKKAG